MVVYLCFNLRVREDGDGKKEFSYTYLKPPATRRVMVLEKFTVFFSLLLIVRVPYRYRSISYLP